MMRQDMNWVLLEVRKALAKRILVVVGVNKAAVTS